MNKNRSMIIISFTNLICNMAEKATKNFLKTAYKF